MYKDIQTFTHVTKTIFTGITHINFESCSEFLQTIFSKLKRLQYFSQRVVWPYTTVSRLKWCFFKEMDFASVPSYAPNGTVTSIGYGIA